MAFPTTLRRSVIAFNGNEGPEYFQADAAMKPGEIVEFVDADEVAVCTTDDYPIGVVGCDADHDLMTDYAAGERVPIWMLGCGVDLYVLCYDADAKTLEFGSYICSSDATAGAGSLQDGYTDTAERTDLMTFVIGRALEGGSLGATTVTYIPVRLST